MHCQAVICDGGCVCGRLCATVGPALSKRRSKLPSLEAFGSLLRELREARALSTGQVQNALSAAGARLGRSTVTQYEMGAVWSPDPVVLAELARLYRSDISALVAVLKANRQDPSLSKERADAIRKGASNAGAASVGVLEQERDEALATVHQMRELASRIVTIAASHAAGAEGRVPRTTQSRGRKAHRAAS